MPGCSTSARCNLLRALGAEIVTTEPERGTRGALCLVQALAASGSSARLWLGVDGLEQSPLWGFAKGVALEHPRLRCAAVEVRGADALASAHMLCDEIPLDGNEEDRDGDQQRQHRADQPRPQLRQMFNQGGGAVINVVYVVVGAH